MALTSGVLCKNMLKVTGSPAPTVHIGNDNQPNGMRVLGDRKSATVQIGNDNQLMRTPGHGNFAKGHVLRCSASKRMLPGRQSKSSSSDNSFGLRAVSSRFASVPNLSNFDASKNHELPVTTYNSAMGTSYREMEKMKDYIEDIRMMFRALNDGEISTSPYDTAWVALVPALDGSSGAQFPKCLEWITRNQAPDGSWGDKHYFLLYDRIVNTLACIVALRTWDVSPEAVELGVKFMNENLGRLTSEEEAHMPIGFEIVFPEMIRKAQALSLNLPYDAPIIEVVEAEREKKMKKIPLAAVHKVTTTVLHSLEGLPELVNWEQLLKLQSSDGSFLASPASTACALIHTKDSKCREYLEKMLEKFGNAVPNVYPVDLFERLWMVDRLERLGIDRYFEREIKDCLDYVYTFWHHGISWARTAGVKDVDDTAMGFRLLRQHGYDVSADVFEQFRGEKGEFFCFAGQSGQAVTGMFNLYRASQTRFPGETVLEDAYQFTRDFLQVKHEKKECFDKWIITKGLEGEVEYALNLPWFASLPRIENRAYLDQYCPDDVWIGKSLYRMHNVNNDTFLALAKADFNLLQSIHQAELHQLLRWNQDCHLPSLPFGSPSVYEWYFSAVAHLAKPEDAVARQVWARNGILTSAIRTFFHCCPEDSRAFLEAARSWDFSILRETKSSTKALFELLYNTVNAQTHEGLFAQDCDLGLCFRSTWVRWMESLSKESEWTALSDDCAPSLEEYLRNAEISSALEPISLVTAFFIGQEVDEDELRSEESRHRSLLRLASRVGRLSDDLRKFKEKALDQKMNAVTLLMREDAGLSQRAAVDQIEHLVSDILVQLSAQVHRHCNIPGSIKQLYFNVARLTNFATVNSDPTSFELHVRKLLFEPVI